MEQQSLLPAQSPHLAAASEPHTKPLEGYKPSASEIAYRNPSEKIAFSDYTTLVLSFDDDSAPLVFQPEPTSIFGRIGAENPEKTVINLKAYDAQYKGVSRLHAVLHRGHNMLQIEDLSSRNGTFVNGRRLIPHELKILHDGDEVRLGALIMRVGFRELA